MKKMKVGLAGSKIWNNPRPIQNALTGLVTSDLVVLNNNSGAGRILKQYAARHSKQNKTKFSFLDLKEDGDTLEEYNKIYKKLATSCDLILIFKSSHSKIESLLIEQCKRAEKPYILFEQ